MRFESSLQIGKVAESMISAWLQQRGASVMPAYEIEKSCGKGPQLFTAVCDYVLPDMLVFRAGCALWIEAKHKSHFSWHRKTQRWVTGIDLRHYADYLKIEKATGLAVWLLFFHREAKPSDNDISYGCPDSCPVGLYGEKLAVLATNENHRTQSYNKSRVGEIGHGRSGMVYWAESSLRMLSTKEQVIYSHKSIVSAKEAACS